MSSSLEKLVPLLEGNNYLIWADAIKSYLRSQGIWQVVSGGYLQPTAPTGNPTAAQLKEFQTENLDWRNKDDAAFGSIMLRVASSLQESISSKANSKEAWDELVARFGTPGPSLVYSDFRTALNTRLSPTNPELDISKIATIFGRMTTNRIVIPSIVQAMILLAACPREYESVSSVLLQNYDNATLSFNIVRDALIADTQRRSTVSKQQQHPTAVKISAVKRKGPNPNWVPNNARMQPESSNAGNKDKGKQKADSARGKRAGNKEKRKQKKQQHGHLASVAIANTDIPTTSELPVVPSTKDPRKQQPAQRFITGAANPNSDEPVYPDYQQARETLENLDLARSARNLKPLETAFTERSLKKRRVDEDASSKTPSKSSDLVLVGSSPTPPPAPFVHWAQDPDVLAASARGDPVSNPNRTYKRWSEIDDCYVDSPVEWASEFSDDSENSPKMKTPCVKLSNDLAIADTVDDELARQKWDEYLWENGGYDKGSVTIDSCTHKTHIDKSVTVNSPMMH